MSRCSPPPPPGEQELEASELDNQLLEPAPVPSTRVPPTAVPELPAVPAAAAPAVPPGRAARPAAAAAKTPEDLELEALQAEMAL